MSKKLTPWFPPEIKPVNVGAYRTKHKLDKPKDVWFQYWNGHHFGPSCESANEAKDLAYIYSDYQQVSWAGLAEKPE